MNNIGRTQVVRHRTLLPVSFFRRPADVVAHDLIGAVLVSTIRGVRTAGRIVEAEAYLGHQDPASHGYRILGRDPCSAPG